DGGSGANLRPTDPRYRIEIDTKLVGMIQVMVPNRVRMQLEAGKIGHPRERGRIARHDFLCGTPGRKFQRDDLDPRRTRGRSALLIEELVADAVGIAHEDIRSIAARANRTIRNRKVVTNEVELRVARVGKKHLLRVRNADFPPSNIQNLGLGAGTHFPTIPAPLERKSQSI